MNILYYPEINIPRTEWAIRAFLYYDEVAAIVPYNDDSAESVPCVAL